MIPFTIISIAIAALQVTVYSTLPYGYCFLVTLRKDAVSCRLVSCKIILPTGSGYRTSPVCDQGKKVRIGT